MDNLGEILLEKATFWLLRAGSVALVFLIFLILAKITKRVIIKSTERLKLDTNITALLARSGSITIIIFGIITALGTIGVNVSALVAGLGLTGFALGFAFKDSISNFLSGILILIYRPFKIGNTIKISGYEGIVVSIDLRYTELEGDGSKILIPNSKLFTEPITISK